MIKPWISSHFSSTSTKLPCVWTFKIHQNTLLFPGERPSSGTAETSAEGFWCFFGVSWKGCNEQKKIIAYIIWYYITIIEYYFWYIRGFNRIIQVFDPLYCPETIEFCEFVIYLGPSDCQIVNGREFSSQYQHFKTLFIDDGRVLLEAWFPFTCNEPCKIPI